MEATAHKRLHALREALRKEADSYFSLHGITHNVFNLSQRIAARHRARQLINDAIAERLFLRDTPKALIELLFFGEPRTMRLVKEMVLPLRQLWRDAFMIK